MLFKCMVAATAATMVCRVLTLVRIIRTIIYNTFKKRIGIAGYDNAKGKLQLIVTKIELHILESIR